MATLTKEKRQRIEEIVLPPDLWERSSSLTFWKDYDVAVAGRSDSGKA